MSENMIVTNAQDNQNIAQQTTVVPKRYRLIFKINNEDGVKEYHLSRNSDKKLYSSTDETDQELNRTPVEMLEEIDMLTSNTKNKEEILKRFGSPSSCDIFIRELASGERLEAIWDSHEIAEHTKKIAEHNTEVEGINYEEFRQGVIDRARDRKKKDQCILERSVTYQDKDDKTLYYFDQDTPAWVENPTGLESSIDQIDKVTMQFATAGQFGSAEIMIDTVSGIIKSSCFRIIRIDGECFHLMFPSQDHYGIEDALDNLDSYGITKINDENGNVTLIPYMDFRQGVQNQIEKQRNSLLNPNKEEKTQERTLTPEEQRVAIFGKAHSSTGRKGWG